MVRLLKLLLNQHYSNEISMNTLFLALEDGSIQRFLTQKKFDEKKSVDQFHDFCKQNSISQKVIDFIFFKESCPEESVCQSFCVKDGKIQSDFEKFAQIKFTQDELPLIQRLIEANDQNIEIAKQNNNAAHKVLFEKNKTYLQNLSVKDFYTETGKINRFFNIGFIEIKDPGSGYTKNIQATISEPTKPKREDPDFIFGNRGEKAKISCSQKNGKLSNIFVEEWGCGYTEQPTITFSEPDEPNGKKPEVEFFPLNLINLK